MRIAILFAAMFVVILAHDRHGIADAACAAAVAAVFFEMLTILLLALVLWLRAMSRAAWSFVTRGS